MSRFISRVFFLSVVFISFLNTSPAAEETKVADNPRVKEALQLLEIWIDSKLDYDQMPGISMAVVHDQELVWSKGFGFSNLKEKVPVTSDTIYSICSISKLFTSIALMQLRDAGKLRLDDPVSKYLSWFDIKKTHPDAPPITVRSLLTHSSGLPRESVHPYWTGPEFPFPNREEIIACLPEQETLYTPDTFFQYSNLGLTLVGEIVAAASGQPYGEYIREHILEPLGLSDTTPYLPEKLLGGQMATGYGRLRRKGGREEVPFFQANGITPAAGFASTAKDLAQFASWQFRVLGDGSDDVLSTYTLKEMYRVHWVDPDWETKWGLGFAIWRSGETIFAGHGGSCPGFRTQLMLCPKDKIAIVFMSNAMGVNTGMYTEQAYKIVKSAIKEASDTSEEQKPAPTDFEKYTGLYSDFWGETAVFLWKGSLATIYLPTDRPADSITKLKHISGHVFKRIRKDGTLGEAIIFELDDDGQVKRFKRHSNYMKKVR